MTGIIGEKIDHGGVNYLRKNIKTTSQQDSIYNVELITGTKLKYTEQNFAKQASVEITSNGDILVVGMRGVEIDGQNDKANTYKLLGCEFSYLNVKDDTKDKVIVKDAITDTGKELNSKNIFVSFNQGDNVNGKTEVENGGKWLKLFLGDD